MITFVDKYKLANGNLFKIFKLNEKDTNKNGWIRIREENLIFYGTDNIDKINAKKLQNGLNPYCIHKELDAVEIYKFDTLDEFKLFILLNKMKGEINYEKIQELL